MSPTLQQCMAKALDKGRVREIAKDDQKKSVADLKPNVLNDYMDHLSIEEAKRLTETSANAACHKILLQRIVVALEHGTILKRTAATLVTVKDVKKIEEHALSHFQVPSDLYSPLSDKAIDSQSEVLSHVCFVRTVYNLFYDEIRGLPSNFTGVNEDEYENWREMEKCIRPHYSLKALYQHVPRSVFDEYTEVFKNASVSQPRTSIIAEAKHLFDNDGNQLLIPPTLKIQLLASRYLQSNRYRSHLIMEQMFKNRNGETTPINITKLTQGEALWIYLLVFCLAKVPHKMQGHQPLYDLILGSLPQIVLQLASEERIAALRTLLNKIAPYKVDSASPHKAAYQHFIVKQYNTALPEDTFTMDAAISKDLLRERSAI